MEVEQKRIIWLQGAGCTGCSISVLNSVSPTIKNLLIDEVVPGQHLSLLFHPTIMAGSGEPVIEVMLDVRKEKGPYVLVVEGAVPTAGGGFFATVGEEDGRPVTLFSRFLTLAREASAIIALGDCSSFGGIPAGRPNPTGCKGVKDILTDEKLDVPVINVSGCAPHPDWFVGTVAYLLLYGLPAPDQLDELGRPKAFYGKLVHENCPRRPYFDEGKFARDLSEEGCLYEVGCKGPFTYADCPTRKWNNGVNWVVGAGSPCLGCTEPGFPDICGPFYRKISDLEKVKPRINPR
ncbi:MAG TPA: oxidoreductase [Candidatus Latescibacteria bacterium]|nr:oxidoreductase [Candidatus Latescibacterota bacterium]